jgi:hypothetical protein
VNTSLLGSDKFNIDPHVRETMPLLEPEDIACAIMYALSTPTRVQVTLLIKLKDYHFELCAFLDKRYNYHTEWTKILRS